MYISCLTHVYPLLQVTRINAAIDRAKSGSWLHGLAHVSHPSYDTVEVLIKCMEYNISTCIRDITILTSKRWLWSSVSLWIS